jgi:hypothetical protein
MRSAVSRACDSSNSASGAPLYSMCAPATISCSAFGIENGLLLSRAGIASRNAIADDPPRSAVQRTQTEAAGVLGHGDDGAEERQVVCEHEDAFAHRAHLAVDGLRDVAGEHVAEDGHLEQKQQQDDVARERRNGIAGHGNDHETQRRRCDAGQRQGVEQAAACLSGRDRALAQQLHQIEQRLIEGRTPAALQARGELARQPKVQEAERRRTGQPRPDEQREGKVCKPGHDVTWRFWSAVRPRASNSAACAMPARICWGRGGHPGTHTSTAMYLLTGPSTVGLRA